MDGGKVLLANFSRGQIGEGPSTLLGGLLWNTTRAAQSSRAQARSAAPILDDIVALPNRVAYVWVRGGECPQPACVFLPDPGSYQVSAYF